jgi:hypothetical protein
MPGKPVTLAALFTDNSRLPGRLCAHAGFLSNLQTRLTHYLDSPLDKHVTVANYANGILVLHADTSSWATRLRYNTPAILAHMKNSCDLPDLKTIRIKTMPVSKGTAVATVKPLYLSSASAGFINQVAACMPDDNLRLSLLKLARHIQKQA